MALGATTQSSRSGLRSFWQPPTTGAASPASAQVIPLFGDPISAPWNAQRVFERTPLPQLDDPEAAEQPEPEDTPVKTRQHPGYEPAGIRSGPWMLGPAPTAGLLHQSNAFSSDAPGQSEAAAVTRAQDGSIIRQDARDGQIYTVHGRGDHALSAKLGWLASAEYNQRERRGSATQSLDSRGYRALTGLNIALTHPITGEFGVGHERQRFDDPAIGVIEGPAWSALITWRPTRLFDVNFKAEQLVMQMSDTSSTGVIANSFQPGVDYGLLRNVIASVAGGIEKDEFHGQERSDGVNTVDSRIKPLPNRYGGISLFHRYTDRNCNIPTFRYEKHLVGFNATAQF